MPKTRSKKVKPESLQLLPFDIVGDLKSRRQIALFLDALLLDGPEDSEIFAHALGAVSRAVGMTEIARKTGLGRESLYKSLNEEGNPSFATVMKVMAAAGVQFRVVER